MRILLLFQFREGVELEFPVVEHWKSIQKMQIEMSFKAWLWLVHAKNMGGKCIWDYSNSTKTNPSWYYRIVQGILSWGWVKGREELKHQYFSWLIRKCSKIELHFIVWTTFKARGDVILTKYWEGEKRKIWFVSRIIWRESIPQIYTDLDKELWLYFRIFSYICVYPCYSFCSVQYCFLWPKKHRKNMK